jgi:hypothetical protein
MILKNCGKKTIKDLAQMKKKIKLINDPAKSTLTWSNSLRLYINIQTILLKKLKYNYLNDSIIFFGSFYESFIQVIININISIKFFNLY